MQKLASWRASIILVQLASLLNAVETGAQYLVSVDASAQGKFGLYYPATYKFTIPHGQTGLAAQFRYAPAASWNVLTEKRSNDLFNGIDAVRFDYQRGFAYISVRFIPASDHIYLRVVDQAGQEVGMSFDSIPYYYDGRKAAATISLDDYGDWSSSYFTTATDYLRSFGLRYTAAVIVEHVNRWDWLQGMVNGHDEMEIAVHSLSHPCSAGGFAVNGYDEEIVGSREGLRSALSFPNHPYLPVYVEPCGYSDPAVESWVTAGEYLVARSASWSSPGGKFAPWDPENGRYGRANIIFDTGVKDVNIRTEGNRLFDQSVAAGGIYHLLDHPYMGLWYDNSDLVAHMNYIKGRSDIWYAPLGHLYQYHFLQEMRGGLTIEQMEEPAPVAAGIGVYRGGVWFLDSNGSGVWEAGSDRTSAFGIPGDIPVTGEWNGDGATRIGVFRQGAWYLDLNGNGAWDDGIDAAYSFGIPSDIPVTGKWSGGSASRIGVFRDGAWHLDMNGNGAWDESDVSYTFGIPGDIPVTGDWTGSGTTKIGVMRSNAWFLDLNGNGSWEDGIDAVYTFGIPGDVPVTGDWTGSGTTKIGVVRGGSAWFLDTNGNGRWDDGADQVLNGFGVVGDMPVSGN